MQKLIKTEKGEWLFVAVPKDNAYLRFSEIGKWLGYNFDYDKEHNTYAYKIIDLDPLFEYTLLGIYPNLSEEVAVSILGNLSGMDDIGAFEKVDHVKELPTLMQANGIYTVNPLGEHKPDFNSIENNCEGEVREFKYSLEQWQQAQACTSECWAVLKVNLLL